MTKTSNLGLQKGSNLVILGKTSRNKSELTTQLKDCGLNYNTQIKTSTTHVLISSRGNKGLDNLPQKQHWQWITEAQLIQYLEQVQPTYLLEEENTSSVEQIVNLIMTLGEENMSLALELIKGGGLPINLLTEVFVVYKLSDVPKTRTIAKKMLLEKAPVELLKVIRKRTKINFKKGRCFYRDRVKSNIVEYAENTPLHLGIIAYAVCLKTAICFDMVLDFAPSKYKKEIIANYLIKNNEFKLPYAESIEKFPMDLLEFSNLTKITIRVYKGKGRRKSSAVVDDSFVLPEEISKLKQLKEIKIWPKVFKKLPIKALLSMEKLEKIDLSVSSNLNVSALKEAFPKCEIRISKRK